MLRLVFMATWLAFVAACAEQLEAPATDTANAPADAPAPGAAAEPEPFEPPARPSVAAAAAAIDWDAARADLAAANAQSGEAVVQIQSGETAPPVPVLIPQGLVTAQAAGGEPPRFSDLPDGYFYHVPGGAYDVTISGTNQVFAGGTDGAVDPEALIFRATAAGAMVSLSRYGADYLVEFECNGAAGALGDSCVAEAEALEIAENLIIAATR